MQADLTALPLLFLADKVIVVGDDEQVSPLSIGTRTEQVDDLRRRLLEGVVSHPESYTAQTSLYDIVLPTTTPVRLTEHFRCVPSIISFSSRLCYNDTIQPLRSDDSAKVHPPFVIHRVAGVSTESDENVQEAKAIAQLMKACFEQPEYNGKTFGVITMRSKSAQIRRIQQEIAKQISTDVFNERRILCGTPADFQGDERDVIFLSFVDSADADDKMLRKEGDKDGLMTKRYNVAVSRAKDQLWLVHSFDWKNQLNPEDLRYKLFSHADNVLRGADDEEEVRREAAPNSQYFEVPVALKLRELGYTITQQEPVGGFRLDIAVFGEKSVRAAIECDGDRYHSGEKKIEEDMTRQCVLERVGWNFIRIRGSEYFRDPEKAMARVVLELEALGIKPEHKERRLNAIGRELIERVYNAADILNLSERSEREDEKESFEPAAPKRPAEEHIREVPAAEKPVVRSTASDAAKINAKPLAAEEAVAARRLSRYDPEAQDEFRKPTAPMRPDVLRAREVPEASSASALKREARPQAPQPARAAAQAPAPAKDPAAIEERFQNAVDELKTAAEAHGWTVIDRIAKLDMIAVLAGEAEFNPYRKRIRDSWKIDMMFLPRGNYHTYEMPAWIMYRPKI